MASPVVDIRPARVKDLPRILEIYNVEVLKSTATYDTEPRTTTEHAQWFEHHGPSYPVLVAAAGGAILGWASLSPWSDRPAYRRAVEVSVYVDEPSRKQGIGRRLLAALVDAARATGHHALLARISADNTASIRLHASVGFELVGTLRGVGFKFGTVLDVAIMELLLPS